MTIEEFREDLRKLVATYVESNDDTVQVMVAILTDERILRMSGYGCTRCTFEAVSRWIKEKNIQHQQYPESKRTH